MSEDLLRRLRMLEEEYPGQPVVAQRADLAEINRLRARLRMPPVDARLREVGAAPPQPPPPPVPVPAADHTEARELYRAYLRKEAELEPHRAYADRVAAATAGRGQTPVRPLATLGPGGGPLLCDHCRKPIVLEGGRFHGVTADVAWRQQPGDWSSWILGGLVVEIQTNGTLRIYHGYPGQGARHCCNAARRADEKSRDAFEEGGGRDKQNLLLAFFAHEFPDMTTDERYRLLSKVLSSLYSYDPGIGVNRPGEG